jgi:NAD(P)-dependent dehydrogenase (short-subunit alcohol dehydrogenase family)
MNTSLEGKRVLVTGGTRGMGAAIAEQLVAHKARFSELTV